MAINDQDIQSLQKANKLKFTKKAGEDLKVILEDGSSQLYKVVVDGVDDVTQAMAVAPYVDGRPDYSQTTIILAGTQSVADAPLDGKHWKSTFNAMQGWFTLTPQTQDVSKFIEEVQDTLGPFGSIYAISGFSQSAVAAAKNGVKYQIPKITTFNDWGSGPAVSRKDFSDTDIEYLKEHLTSYSDSGKDLTFMDGGFGEIAYGKVRTVEGTQGLNNPIGDHRPSFFKLKGDDLDIDYYVRKGIYCSGMTEEQVRTIAKKRAGDTWWEWDDDAEVERYLKEYKKKYGPFASQTEYDIRACWRTIGNLHTQLSLSDVPASKRVSLRKDLILQVASLAEQQSAEYQRLVTSRLQKAQQEAEDVIRQARNYAYAFVATHLPPYEVETILGGLDMAAHWNAGIEQKTLQAAADYERDLKTFSERLQKAANNIEEVDRTGALSFTN